MPKTITSTNVGMSCNGALNRGAVDVEACEISMRIAVVSTPRHIWISTLVMPLPAGAQRMHAGNSLAQ
jgi:hypothetical protein